MRRALLQYGQRSGGLIDGGRAALPGEGSICAKAYHAGRLICKKQRGPRASDLQGRQETGRATDLQRLRRGDAAVEPRQRRWISDDEGRPLAGGGRQGRRKSPEKISGLSALKKEENHAPSKTRSRLTGYRDFVSRARDVNLLVTNERLTMSYERHGCEWGRPLDHLPRTKNPSERAGLPFVGSSKR